MRNIFDETTFESEIIKIADQVFSGYSDRKINYNIEGIEHDAFYETDFVIHCLEITTSRRAAKAAQDLDKLSKAIEFYNKIYKGKKTIRGWFITKDPLSAEQFEIQRRFSSVIQHEHFKEFHARLIDSVKFLQARENHRFGSIEPISKLTSSKADVPKDSVYVDVPFVRTKQKNKTADSGVVSRWLTQEIKNKILILGDFGAGKSSFLKRIYDSLARQHLQNKQIRFPIYLNLREFAELESPDEALRRHARRIGLNDFGEALIRAWKADYTFLLIDGFDEAVPRLTAREAKRFRDLRHQALLIVRRLVSESPQGTPIVLAGRSGFFQTDQELSEALGIDQNWERLEAKDFEVSDVNQLKKMLSSEVEIPTWLPRRPLLITYYILWSMEEKSAWSDEVSEEIGWLRLLEQFCEREISQIDNLPLVKEDLLDIFGELSVTARKRHLKIGPISLSDLTSAYRHIMKDEPSGNSLGQLMRIPGLVGQEQAAEPMGGDPLRNVDNSNKNFLSYELVEVASARYLSKYFLSQNREILQNWVGIKAALTTFGMEVLNHLLKTSSASIGDIKSALHSANNMNTANFSQVDMISYVSFYYENVSIANNTINIDDIETDVLNISNQTIDFRNLIINNSYVKNLYISVNTPFAASPSINGSIVENIFLDCESDSNGISKLITERYCTTDIDKFNFDMDNIIFDRNIDEKTKVLKNILRKTYVQSVKGRMESALRAGEPNENFEMVDSLIVTLEKNGLLRRERVQGENRWHPQKHKRSIVEMFLSNPTDEKAAQIING